MHRHCARVSLCACVMYMLPPPWLIFHSQVISPEPLFSQLITWNCPIKPNHFCRVTASLHRGRHKNRLALNQKTHAGTLLCAQLHSYSKHDNSYLRPFLTAWEQKKEKKEKGKKSNVLEFRRRAQMKRRRQGCSKSEVYKVLRFRGLSPHSGEFEFKLIVMQIIRAAVQIV